MSNVPFAFSECRVSGHDWNTTQVAFLPAFIFEGLECERCKTEVRIHVERGTGFIKSRSYSYPKGYQQKGGISREQLGQLRIAVLEEKVRTRV